MKRAKPSPVTCARISHAGRLAYCTTDAQLARLIGELGAPLTRAMQEKRLEAR